jgi:hypothetical protein
MFDGLSRGEHRGIKNLRIGDLVHLVLGFLDQADDRLALHAARRLIDFVEDFFEPLDLAFRLAMVMFEGLFQLSRFRLACHFGKSTEDSALGVEHVAQHVEEQVLERFDGHRYCFA